MQIVAHGAQDIYYEFELYYTKHIIEDIVVGFEIYKVEFIKIEWTKINGDIFDKFKKYNVLSVSKKSGKYNQFNKSTIECKDMFNFGYKAINCEKCHLTKLPKFKSIDKFKKMTHFNCSINRIKNIEKLTYTNELIFLNCSYNNIKSIPKKIFSLEYFDLSNNSVGGDIDVYMYPNLKYLLASSNLIKSIKNLSANLEYLDLSNNPISELEYLPCGLKYLLIVKTNIKSINFSELENLEYLDISINDLTTSCLDGLPSSLIYLNCSQCGISKLNNLPNIIQLICINNYIQILEMLPETLEYLDCDHNNITKLDDLPNNLNTLICSNNSITSLNNLPKNLIELDCGENNIKIIHNLPPKIKQIKYTNHTDDDSEPISTKYFKCGYDRITSFILDTTQKIKKRKMTLDQKKFNKEKLKVAREQYKYFDKANKYKFKNKMR